MGQDNWDVWTLDNLWHFLGGLAVNGIVFAGIGYLVAQGYGAVASSASGVVMVTAAAFDREFEQHRGRVPIFRRHNVAEALWWGVGALAAFGVFLGLYLGGVL